MSGTVAAAEYCCDIGPVFVNLGVQGSGPSFEQLSPMPEEEAMFEARHANGRERARMSQ